MLVLGIDTATPQTSVAIGGHEGVIASTRAVRNRLHAELLTPAIQFVSAQSGIGLDEIGVVAVDVGPGLFTGLRVGISAAKAIAYALGVPMIGVSSLDLVAFPARWSDRTVLAAIDARRGEVFHARYRRVPGGIQRLSEPAVDHPEDVVDQLLALGEDVLVVGDGGERYADLFGRQIGVELAAEGFIHPDAGALVELAHARALREEFVNTWEVEPLYLREPDARVNFAARDTGTGQ